MQHPALAEKDPAYLYPHQAVPRSVFRFLTHESPVMAGDYLWLIKIIEFGKRVAGLKTSYILNKPILRITLKIIDLL